MTVDDGRRLPAVELVPLCAEVFAALAEGDLAAAEQVSPVPLSACFAGPAWRSVWRRRARQLAEAPGDAAWVTQVVWDVDQQRAVGRAGFHGPPDHRGVVEIGYAVEPAFRQQGWARASLLALLERAGREPDVRVVRLTISPGNAVSRRLAVSSGFVEVGEQVDAEDGLELVYERPA